MLSRKSTPASWSPVKSEESRWLRRNGEAKTRELKGQPVTAAIFPVRGEMIPPGNKTEASLEKVENENDIQPPPPASTTSQESKVSRTSGVCIIYKYIQTDARKHSVTDGLLVNSPIINQSYLYSNTFQLTYRCLSPAR